MSGFVDTMDDDDHKRCFKLPEIDDTDIFGVAEERKNILDFDKAYQNFYRDLEKNIEHVNVLYDNDEVEQHLMEIVGDHDDNDVVYDEDEKSFDYIEKERLLCSELKQYETPPIEYEEVQIDINELSNNVDVKSQEYDEKKENVAQGKGNGCKKNVTDKKVARKDQKTGKFSAPLPVKSKTASNNRKICRAKPTEAENESHQNKPCSIKDKRENHESTKGSNNGNMNIHRQISTKTSNNKNNFRNSSVHGSNYAANDDSPNKNCPGKQNKSTSHSNFNSKITIKTIKDKCREQSDFASEDKKPTERHAKKSNSFQSKKITKTYEANKSWNNTNENHVESRTSSQSIGEFENRYDDKTKESRNNITNSIQYENIMETRANYFQRRNDINQNKAKFMTSSESLGEFVNACLCRNQNHPEDNILSAATSLLKDEMEKGETSEDNSKILRTKSPEYDFDGEFDDPLPEGDLSTFDFEHMTKRPIELNENQKNYLKFSEMAGVLPNGHILRNLTSQELRLNGLSLGRKRLKALCAALLINSYVKILEISEDEIDSQSMAYLLDTLSENTAIEQLFLMDNKMGRHPVKLLMDYLFQNDPLFSLSIAGNCLNDADGVVIAPYVGVTQTLTVLDLSNNQLELESAELLSKAMAKNTSIQTLSLQWNHMSGRAVAVFVSCLLRNRSLINLDMCWNGFDTAATNMLCKALRVNNTLNNLEIASCRITGPQLGDIVGALKKNTGLKTITLGGNIFSCNEIYDVLLDLVKHKGQLVLKELDFLDTPVLQSALSLVMKLMDEKDMMVVHGPIIGRFGQENDADILATLNPTTVLIEFGNIMHMTLNELFEFMDEDGSGTLSREEIKDGLLNFNIPLSERSLDLLIRHMDRDGDGAISMQELTIMGYTKGRARISDMLYERESESKQNTNNRCRKILKRLLADQQKKQDAMKLKEEVTTSSSVNENNPNNFVTEQNNNHVNIVTEQNNNHVNIVTEKNTNLVHIVTKQDAPRKESVIKLPPITENNKVTGK